MTSSQPLHSSFRTRTLPSNKITYHMLDKPNPVNREYGLMRIPAQEARTPHPRLTLKLDDSYRNIFEGESREGNINYCSSIQYDKRTVQRMQRVPPEHMLIGTPHPIKGLALDPKLLMKDYIAKRERLSMLKGSFDASKPPSILKNDKFEMDISRNYRIRKPGKKVTLIDPKKSTSLTATTSPDSSNASLSELLVTPQFPPTWSNQNLSFVERRRLFNEAEFTIAKYGNKMNNHVMPISKRTIACVESEIAQKDKMAINEIKEYIKRHGYIMSHCALTNTINITHRTIVKDMK